MGVNGECEWVSVWCRGAFLNVFNFKSHFLNFYNSEHLKDNLNILDGLIILKNVFVEDIVFIYRQNIL